MRLLLLVILLASMLSGCDWKERLDSPENRINAAVPPNAQVQEARRRLTLQLSSHPQTQASLDAAWAARLKLRALNCIRDRLPTWRDAPSGIATRLRGNTCLDEADRALLRWVGLQRVQWMLSQPPAQSVKDTRPASYAHDDLVGQVIPARDAPVAILRGRKSFTIVDLASGRHMLKDWEPYGPRDWLDPSPNGRLFSQGVQGKVVIRTADSGEALVELDKADAVLWLNANAMVLRGPRGSGLRLLDLITGEETPVPGSDNTRPERATRVPGSDLRFNLMMARGADQIELVAVGGRHEARLVKESRTPNWPAWAPGITGQTADGALWIAGVQDLRQFRLDTLLLTVSSFKPVEVLDAWPTSKAQEMLLSLGLPGADRLPGRSALFLYDSEARTLAPVGTELPAEHKYVYLDALKRLGQLDGSTLRVIEQLPVGEPRPMNQVLAPMIEALNQQRMAEADGVRGQQVVPDEVSDSQGNTSSQGYFVGRKIAAPVGDAQIEGVGVHEGPNPRQGVNQPTWAGTVDVSVRRSARSRALALVLSAHEPVRWRLNLQPGARLVAVFLTGNTESTVAGADGLPVLHLGRTSAYQSGSAELVNLQRLVRERTGGVMEHFQGLYSGSGFIVGRY